jgi:hypothetical protein
MKFEIYHQLGYNYKWNLESLLNEGAGDGVILAPKYMDRSTVEGLNQATKAKSIFDPQFFNPHEINERMETYGFYPKSLMPSGYDTKKFSGFSTNCADSCMEFQIANDFRYLVIPTIYVKGMPNVENVVDFQTTHFINPALAAIEKRRSKKDVVIQLVLNNQIITDTDYANYLLDWITGLEGIKGVYLVVEPPSEAEQIDDSNYLYSLLTFIDGLTQNKLIVILGYTNSESILLSVANPTIITIGSHKNLRKFNHLRFENYEEEPGVKRKTPYVYIPPLLDWIDFRMIQAHLKRSPTFKNYLGKNKYSDEMLKASYNPNKVKNRYDHFFVEGSKQLKEINKFDGKERYDYVKNLIGTAIENRSLLTKELGIPIANEGYLTQWLIAVNLFASDKGWRE